MNKDEIINFINSSNADAGDGRTRIISFLSALIALCKSELTESALGCLEKVRFDKKAVYEVIVQSYLFLGFPRMIEAAIAFDKVYGKNGGRYEVEFTKISATESDQWFNNGINLCKLVYGKNFDRLKKRFMAISPEMFRWMVIEGYGKVLSRPGLNSVERELAEVAALIVDRRERQLISHLMGSLNVGASAELIRKINEDVRPLAGEDAYRMTGRLLFAAISKYDSQI
jgi:alkylhydroperoxidase/carboxymuconolactone decarboxylase family protein YurZ